MPCPNTEANAPLENQRQRAITACLNGLPHLLRELNSIVSSYAAPRVLRVISGDSARAIKTQADRRIEALALAVRQAYPAVVYPTGPADPREIEALALAVRRAYPAVVYPTEPDHREIASARDLRDIIHALEENQISHVDNLFAYCCIEGPGFVSIFIAMVIPLLIHLLQSMLM